MKRFFSRSPNRTDESSVPSPAAVPTSLPHPHLQPKYVVPPVPHPAPYEHVALLATKEGLLMRPYELGAGTSSIHGAKIAWGRGGKIEEISVVGEWEGYIVVHGIVGILELFSSSYLLVITAKTDVGNLLEENHLIYGVKGVIAIPLHEEGAHERIRTLASRVNLSHLSTSRTLDTIPTISKPSPRIQFAQTPIPVSDYDSNTAEHTPRSRSPSEASSISSEASSASPVIKALASRLSFWNRLSPGTRDLKQASDDVFNPSPKDEKDILEEGDPEEVLAHIVAPEPISPEERHSELERKIVKECVKEFTKGGMFFAYNFDITRSMQHKRDLIAKTQKQSFLLADLNVFSSHKLDHTGNVSEPNPMLPLWRRVDRKYWWNEWLAKPFIDAGLHPYVLPIMQGYCQISTFDIPEDGAEDPVPVEYVLISRRSRDRAGLRYQRRGVDDEAHVANFVETETIMQVAREGKMNTFSYVQIRGSIPLYWTQTGYGLKPPPVLAADRTHKQNLDAMKRHFGRTVPLYGPHTVVNLAEQHGKEAAVTQGYRDCMAELALPDVQYHEYDFHVETKGMKYENISKLIDKMDRTFEHQGFLWISDANVLSTQKGAFRVNCIDCLDRTNVVQSAFARHVLQTQLRAVALVGGTGDNDLVFNDVWANNGDAISRAYAGTSALKGDFTRTGKRDLSGLLNDGVNSLARMYTSTFSDWFCQAVIDFMLGHRTLSVFSEFLLKLQSTDPRDLIRLSKIRAEAIATSVARVLEEGERLLAGWTMFAPEEMAVKVGDKWEEKVLLLTARAIYIISYDYTLQKVKKYTRVPLGDITGITKGTYILSPLEEASRDPEQNAGFVIEWLSTREITRMTSYSMRNSLDLLAVSPPLKSNMSSPGIKYKSMTVGSGKASRVTLSSILGNGHANDAEKTFAALKMLPIDPTRSQSQSASSEEVEIAGSCREAVNMVVERIKRACEDVGGVDSGFVREGDVVSLAEAQRMTSMYTKMEYGVKRLLWLGG
ncbi:inositol 5'-phosphatase [Desarmillaria tabescens]|uniref:SacI homology domain-containing protein n=1 Tax=Armillaria tabescens TaxID=1929756 RepID=A0AA39TZK8_ARMTA|nr:inositol 5'-phosphatase [Desarmillaria tabescens]KAK0463920.1 SacI homology domain-containing protein [Desarmillaria tabescens]